MCMGYFRNASARRRSRCSSRTLNGGDSAVCESHFKATPPTARPRVIPFHDCFCSGGGFLTTYRRGLPGRSFFFCRFCFLLILILVFNFYVAWAVPRAVAAAGHDTRKKV